MGVIPRIGVLELVPKLAWCFMEERVGADPR